MPGFGPGAMAGTSTDWVADLDLTAQLFDESFPYLVRGCFSMDQFELPAPPPKRQKVAGDGGGGGGGGGAGEGAGGSSQAAEDPTTDLKRKSSIYSSMSLPEVPVSDQQQQQQSAPPVAPVKSKRVRTGCLTCRERHLKCDEATPGCMNCRKSNRECKRGVRLNFIDVQVKDPPRAPPTVEWAGELINIQKATDAALERRANPV